MMAPSSVPARTAARAAAPRQEPGTPPPPLQTGAWGKGSSHSSLSPQGFSAALRGFSPPPRSVGEHLPMGPAEGLVRGPRLPRPFIAFRSTCASPSSLKAAAGCTVPWSCGGTEGSGAAPSQRGGGREGQTEGRCRPARRCASRWWVSASTWGWVRTSPPPGHPFHRRARHSQAGRGWGGGCRQSLESRSAARCRARLP